MRGILAKGNICIHDRKRKRYRCTRCKKTFSARAGTAYFRLHKEEWLFTTVVKLLSYGCPIQAAVETFELDERTVSDWLVKAGAQAQRVQEHLIERGELDLKHVQADELYGKMVAPHRMGEPPTSPEEADVSEAAAVS